MLQNEKPQSKPDEGTEGSLSFGYILVMAITALLLVVLLAMLAPPLALALAILFALVF